MSKLYLTTVFKWKRQANSWTQQQMADSLSVELKEPVSRQRVQAWERGVRSIDATLAMRISTILSINYKDLVEKK